MVQRISNKHIIASKIKSLIFVLLAIIIYFAFAGCRPNLRARYVESTEADSNMVFYMSEVDKLMESKGYNNKTDKLSSWKSVYGLNYMDTYELDDNALLVYGTSCHNGEEQFLLAVFSSSNELFDKTSIYSKLVSEILNVVSGYDISEEYMNEFCDEAQYDDSSTNYTNQVKLDYHGYYNLDYITRDEGSVVPESIGPYNVYFSVSGLTKTGLQT